MIPQRNLSLLSNRLARQGGRRIPEAVLERDYCLAWFLVGLSRSPLRMRLAFKGGTAIKRCCFGDYRFSEDLDFTLIEEVPFETIRAELEPVFEEVRRGSGVMLRHEREDRQGHAPCSAAFARLGCWVELSCNFGNQQRRDGEVYRARDGQQPYGTFIAYQRVMSRYRRHHVVVSTRCAFSSTSVRPHPGRSERTGPTYL